VSPIINLAITSIDSLGSKKPEYNQEEPNEFIIEANTPPNRTVRQLTIPSSFGYASILQNRMNSNAITAEQAEKVGI
jgi:hypothetical protein